MVVVIVAALYAAIRFLPDRAVTYDTMVDHFKYGSTGGDRVTGIPFWIWQAMPLVCAENLKEVAGDRLADDYVKRVARYERGESAPANRRELSREGYKALGFSTSRMPTGRSGISPSGSRSAAAWVWTAPISTARFVIRAPCARMPRTPALSSWACRPIFSTSMISSILFSSAAKTDALARSTLSPKSRASAAISGSSTVTWFIPSPSRRWNLRSGFSNTWPAFPSANPTGDPAATTPSRTTRFFYIGEPWRETMPDWWKTRKVDPEGIGIVDWPSIWLQGPRKKRSDGRPMQLHWDGNNDMVEERNLNAALATSALPGYIDHESIECIEQWLETFEPPKYENFSPSIKRWRKKASRSTRNIAPSATGATAGISRVSMSDS